MSLALIAAGLWTGQTLAQEQQPAAPAAGGVTAADGYLEVIERIDPRVWVIREATPFHLQPIGNVTVIEQSDGLVLIDSGGSPGSGRRIVELVRSVSRRPVKAVVITHWHGDHPLGLPAILAAWPRARIIATEQTRANLTGRSMARYPRGAPDPARTARFVAQIDATRQILERLRQAEGISAQERDGFAATLRELVTYRDDVDGLFVAEPTETFRDRLRLDDRVAPVELIHPGRANTDGDAIAWLPRQRIVVTGDVVVAPFPFGFNSYPRDWLRALQQIRALDFVTLIPGHGAPQRDRIYLDRLAALIEEVRRQVAPLAAQGMTLADVRARIDLSAQRQLFVGDDPWLRRWFDHYWTTPFTESVWKEARGEPITQGEG